MSDAVSSATASLAQTAGAQEGIDKLIVQGGLIAKFTYRNFVPKAIHNCVDKAIPMILKLAEETLLAARRSYALVAEEHMTLRILFANKLFKACLEKFQTENMTCE